MSEMVPEVDTGAGGKTSGRISGPPGDGSMGYIRASDDRLQGEGVWGEY